MRAPAVPPPVPPRRTDRRGRLRFPWSDGSLRRQDPTYGRVDHDIQWDVWSMLSENGTRPIHLSQLVVIESTMQERRDRAGGRAPYPTSAEVAQVRVFGLHRPPRRLRFIDDGDGIRAGFVILAVMVAGLVILGLALVGLWQLVKP